MPYKLKRRGKTVWRGRIKRGEKSVSKEFQTRNQALSWEVAMRQHQNEPVEKTPSISLLEWATEYLAYAMRYAPKTFSEKRMTFRRLFKIVDSQSSVESLTNKQALDFIQAQFEIRSGYAANKDRKNTGAAWNWGVKYLGLPSANPFLQAERFPESRSPRYIPPVTDFEKVLEAATGQDKLLLLALLYLAARKGELFRLRWDDVDFSSGTVRLGTKKRKDGSMEYAEIPMASELYEAMLEHRQSAVNEWVFVQSVGRHSGKPYTENRGFPQELCEEIGVKPFGCHAIRHLTASILASRDVPMVTIQAILRHKKLATTERYVRGLAPVRPALEILRGGTNRSTNEKPGGGNLRVLSSK